MYTAKNFKKLFLKKLFLKIRKFDWENSKKSFLKIRNLFLLLRKLFSCFTNFFLEIRKNLRIFFLISRKHFLVNLRNFS